MSCLRQAGLFKQMQGNETLNTTDNISLHVKNHVRVVKICLFDPPSDPFGPTFGPTFGHPAKRIPMRGARFRTCFKDFRTRLRTPSDPPSDPFRNESLLRVQDFGLSDPITRLDL